MKQTHLQRVKPKTMKFNKKLNQISQYFGKIDVVGGNSTWKLRLLAETQHTLKQKCKKYGNGEKIQFMEGCMCI